MGEVSDSGDAVGVKMVRNEAGIITSVDESMVRLLGWRPDQLVGRPSTQFIHPEDQASGIAAWMRMMTSPGTTSVWRGRYRTAEGAWRWVETTNRHGDSPHAMVVSSMSAVTGDQMSVDEELRSRTQMLSRLADALPVGLFEIDATGHVKLTNARFHSIVGAPPAATIRAQLATVVDDDQPIIERVISAVLADRPVADTEVRFDTGSGGIRTCLLSVRTLNDSSGGVSGAIGLISDVTESVALRRQLEVRASHDELTSCLNRAATIALLDTVLIGRDPADRGVAVIFIDLDRFKAVNDQYGHAAGDRLLVAVADRVRGAVRDRDRVGRMGGDEFLVVCPDVADPAAATAVADRIATALHCTVDVGTDSVDLRASLGVAWTNETLDADVLIDRADIEMYKSKRAAAHTQQPVAVGVDGSP